jgi:carboxyl-terminal processing protease
MRYVLRFLLVVVIGFFSVEAKLPQLTPSIVKNKIQEILQAHASFKQLDEEIVKRTLHNYLEELDPLKTYFILSEIEEWINPSQQLLSKILSDYQQAHFELFFQIHEKMVQAVYRHRKILQGMVKSHLESLNVDPNEFKKMSWAKNEEELLSRLTRLRALQVKTASKLSPEVGEKALQRVDKRRTKFEEDILNSERTHRECFNLSNVLKACSSALDAHTAYFTPDEAARFLVSVQQRLYGIGAQLRDDIDGFTVVKVIDGGPAAEGKELKPKDRIIAVNGEPVVGMDITEAVEKIHGEEHSDVALTVIRENKENASLEEKKEIKIKRGEVIFNEARYQSSYEPFGNGIIAYLRLHSFYQDQGTSSAADLAKEIERLKKENALHGVILDLRYNVGGLLTQAVEVTGLFITKGIVASIKDNVGKVQHLRNLQNQPAWDGPLIVLVNKISASASEIVAQALQDYGRAIVVGDMHTYGKGSFQTFTLNTTRSSPVSPEGEYKVTRGRYYTVSGKTPQLVGVQPDIVVPGALSEIEVGEKFGKYPLSNDRIKENYDDDLSDIPFTHRDKVKVLYKFDLQSKLKTYLAYISKLQVNSSSRIAMNKNYQNFVKQLKKDNANEGANPIVDDDAEFQYGQNDLQLAEVVNIMKDLLLFMQCDGKCF